MAHSKKPRLSLTELLHQAFSWTLVGDEFVAHTKSPNGGVYGYSVTNEQLAQINPELPDSLALSIVCTNTGSGNKTVSGEVFAAIKRGLSKTKNYAFTNLQGETCCGSAITRVNFDDFAAFEAIHIYGTINHVTYVHSIATRKERMVLNQKINVLTISSAEMTKHFPYWEVRYALAKDLGLDDQQLVDFLTDKVVAVRTIAIPTLDVLASF